MLGDESQMSKFEHLELERLGPQNEKKMTYRRRLCGFLHFLESWVFDCSSYSSFFENSYNDAAHLHRDLSTSDDCTVRLGLN